MKTSYEGCQPEVAKSLKRGEHIQCKVSDAHGLLQGARTVVAFCNGKYLCQCRNQFNLAKPIKTKTQVIDAMSMMKGLLAREYKQLETGTWMTRDGKHKVADTVFYECGTCPAYPNDYDDWMLVEKEQN